MRNRIDRLESGLHGEMQKVDAEHVVGYETPDFFTFIGDVYDCLAE